MLKKTIINFIDLLNDFLYNCKIIDGYTWTRNFLKIGDCFGEKRNIV